MASDRPKWYLVSLPNPNIKGFRVVVPQKTLVNNPEWWPQLEDRYSQFRWAPDTSLQADNRFGLYQYTNNKESQTAEGDPAITFYYGPFQTEEQKNTPFRSVTVKRNHPWPPVLYSLVLIPDYTFLRTGSGYDADTNEISQVVAPNHYVREVFKPGINEGTRTIKREYFAATRFDIPQTPVPIPTSVSYDINGVRGSFPECLHPKIEIQSTRSGIAQVVGTAVSPVGGSLEGQIFPATNFEDWAPYISSDTQTEVDGGWYRTQYLEIPPGYDDIIIQ